MYCPLSGGLFLILILKDWHFDSKILAPKILLLVESCISPRVLIPARCQFAPLGTLGEWYTWCTPVPLHLACTLLCLQGVVKGSSADLELYLSMHFWQFDCKTVLLWTPHVSWWWVQLLCFEEWGYYSRLLAWKCLENWNCWEWPIVHTLLQQGAYESMVDTLSAYVGIGVDVWSV